LVEHSRKVSESIEVFSDYKGSQDLVELLSENDDDEEELNDDDAPLDPSFPDLDETEAGQQEVEDRDTDVDPLYPPPVEEEEGVEDEIDPVAPVDATADQTTIEIDLDNDKRNQQHEDQVVEKDNVSNIVEEVPSKHGYWQSFTSLFVVTPVKVANSNPQDVGVKDEVGINRQVEDVVSDHQEFHQEAEEEAQEEEEEEDDEADTHIVDEVEIHPTLNETLVLASNDEEIEVEGLTVNASQPEVHSMNGSSHPTVSEPVRAVPIKKGPFQLLKERLIRDLDTKRDKVKINRTVWYTSQYSCFIASFMYVRSKSYTC